MLLPNGREIPDPPTDPKERELWKLCYHASLYSANPTTLAEWLDQHAPLPQPWWRRLLHRLSQR